MVQSVAVSRVFEARLRNAATGKPSLSTQQKMCTFFELGKDKAARSQPSNGKTAKHFLTNNRITDDKPS